MPLPPSHEPDSNITDPGGPGKGNHTTLLPNATTSSIQSKNSESRSSPTSFVPKWTPTTSVGASASMPALPPHTPPKIHPPLESGLGCTLVKDGGCFPNTNKTAQGNFLIKKRVSMAGNKYHVPIHARSTPGNDTSTPSNRTSHTKKWNPLFPSYSLHFLTNCQWSVKNEIERCTKPWDFVGYSLERHLLEDDDEGGDDGEDDDEKDDRLFQSFPLLFKRNGDNNTKFDVEKHKKNARKLIDNRDAFSKVHLTGCVFVGLSFLCTAISFFILPALGQWISVGNLALATLATIFLFTSSIFTAVMTKKIRSVMENGEGLQGIDAEPGKTFGLLV